MTKLFSMKSLACAGAMAFALTLTAAPQASAAAGPAKLEATVDYAASELVVTVDKGEDAEGNGIADVIKTADGEGLYFGKGKEASKLKYNSVVTSEDGVSNDKITFDISGLLGKETTVGVSFDAEGTVAGTVKLEAAPSLKASLDKNDIKIKVGGTDVAAGLADKAFKDYKVQYKVGNYGIWVDGETDDQDGDPELVEAIKKAKILGSTIYVRVAKAKVAETANTSVKAAASLVQTSPWSKEAKVKVAAKAKAPKIKVKTANLTKAFEWKMGSKVEYRVGIDTKSTAWKTGGDKADWSKIVADAVGATPDKDKDKDIVSASIGLVAADVEQLVAGDAVADDITIQVRTAATEKKDASSISVLKLAASEDSPTVDVIKVAAINTTKKTGTASAASIAPGTVPTGYMAQYSLDDGKKWKKLANEVKLERDKLNGGKVKVRLVGSDAKKTILPSAVTEVIIPENGTAGQDDNKGNLTGTVIKKDSKKWVTKDIEDYSATKTGTDDGLKAAGS